MRYCMITRPSTQAFRTPSRSHRRPSPPAQGQRPGAHAAADRADHAHSMTLEPAGHAAAPAAGSGDEGRPQRRRRSVRSQSALAVVGRMGGTPYSAWADSYLRRHDDMTPARDGSATPLDAAAVHDGGAESGLQQPPPPPNPFDAARGLDNSAAVAASRRPRGTLSEIMLRHNTTGLGAADGAAEAEDAATYSNAAHGRWRPERSDGGTLSGRQPIHASRAGSTSRRHSDASVLRCSEVFSEA